MTQRKYGGLGSLVVALLAAAPVRGATQVAGSLEQPRAGALILGRVIDSIANVPIASAEVHLLSSDTARPPIVAFTDSVGVFRVAGVQRGRYVGVFFHSALEDLALKPRVFPFDVDADTMRVTFATPGARSVLLATCGERTRDASLIIGRVVDADSDEPRAGAQLVVTWIETVIGHGIHQERRIDSTVSDAQGRYAFCGIPEGTVSLRATIRSAASGWLEPTVEAGGVVRLRVAISTRNTTIGWESADGSNGESVRLRMTLDRGSAALDGNIRTDRGDALPGAQATLRGTGRTSVTDSQGRFRLDSLPAGTQELEVRAIGYSPIQHVIDLHAGQSSRVDLRFAPRIVALDTVRVTEAASRSSAFAARKTRGMGYFLTREDVGKFNPLTFADVARRIPGLHGLATPGGTVLRWRDGCAPTVYVNGLRITNGSTATKNAFMAAAADVPIEELQQDVDFIVDPASITGVEVYPPHAAPLQYPGGSCATVLVWAGFPPP